jgi:hypothetical protein
MAQPVVHFEIMGKDGAKTREFYGKLFGWQYQVMEEMNYGLVSPAGDGSIGGGVGGAMNGAPPYITFYIHVDNLKASLDKAESLGGKTACRPRRFRGPAPVPYSPIRTATSSACSPPQCKSAGKPNGAGVATRPVSLPTPLGSYSFAATALAMSSEESLPPMS